MKYFAILLAFFQLSCNCYQVQQSGNGSWCAMRNQVVIPEYTQTSRFTFAPTQETAETLFLRRKAGLEKFINKKYEQPPKRALDWILRPLVVLIGLPVDILLLIPNAVRAGMAKHRRKEADIEWFGLTKAGFYETECTGLDLGGSIFDAFSAAILGYSCAPSRSRGMTGQPTQRPRQIWTHSSKRPKFRQLREAVPVTGRRPCLPQAAGKG